MSNLKEMAAAVRRHTKSYVLGYLEASNLVADLLDDNAPKKTIGRPAKIVAKTAKRKPGRPKKA